MKRRHATYVLLGVLSFGTSIFVAALNLPHTFQPGTVISSAEVNANFEALEDGKQELVTGSCAAGSAIRVVNEDGTVVCEVDDLGSSGSSGVDAVNGMTGAVVLQAGSNISIDDSTPGEIVISATAGTGGTGGDYWSLGGNTGTSAGTNFLGTTDDEPLELRVNGERVLRLEPGSESPNVIAGHSSNSIVLGGNQPSVVGATIAGGGGGGSDLGNQVTDDFGTVAGGSANQAGDSPINGDNKPYATVGGGRLNRAEGAASTVAGGSNNTAGGTSAAVAGGGSNGASGDFAAVPGGQFNSAGGDLSLAAGFRARASHAGSFVWADTTNADFVSTANNQFNVRASGGTRVFSGGSTGVSLAPGSGSWASLSDRAAKENFEEVNRLDVLEQVASLPVHSWNYITQGTEVRHIGPTAQDFRAAFGLGENDTTITTVDADGVALVAIQGLYQLLQDRDTRIAQLEAQNARLEARLLALEQVVLEPALRTGSEMYLLPVVRLESAMTGEGQ